MLTVSSKLSGTYSGVNLVAKKYKNVFVIDSLSAGHAIITLVKKLESLLKEMSIENAIKEIDKIKKGLPIYLIPGDLMFTAKSGRLNPVIARFAKITGITPILTVKNGEISNVAKARSIKKWLPKLKNIVKTKLIILIVCV